ncbi:isopeptide-forming domain-containing fimbrial protein [uncultured Secundilactobacillus sp.]|uniref:isopeptide-forming domain-containing fimbrial protein n=1 Tax=uncultured Secundilactobacillus sp. TaxID=2813935 RepID=UPI0025896ADC|nr:isopeptide-forming domain-containing fimbrial protein [uncultured Secundilactobacillus sp.]
MQSKLNWRRGLQTMALLGVVAGMGWAQQQTAQADSQAPKTVATKTGFPAGTMQQLLISPNTDNAPVKVQVTGGNASQMTQTNLEPGKAYESFLKKYGSTKVAIPTATTADQLKATTMTAQYGVVGSLKGSGDPVTAKVELSQFVPSTKWATLDQSKYAPSVEFSNNLYSGFDTKGLQSMTLKLTFTDQKTGKDLSFNKDAYISWNSLNGNAKNTYGNGHAVEAVAYLNNKGDNPVYVTADSVISQYKSPLDSSLTLTGGSPQETQSWAESSAEKDLGAKGFTRHSASYLLNGTTQEFSINSFDPAQFGTTPTLSKTNGQDYWFAPNSATVFVPTPEKPTKKVIDPDTKANMDKQLVKPGQKLQYQLSQKVSYLGQDSLERYGSLTWSDKLPAGFKYDKAYLIDAKGNKVTADSIKQADSQAADTTQSSTTSDQTASSASDSSAKTSTASQSTSGASQASDQTGTTSGQTTDTTGATKTDNAADWAGSASFDKATNTVTYKASKEFLAAMPMQGETYTLAIDGSVDNDTTVTTLTNQGKVDVDGTATDTNQVTNQITKETPKQPNQPDVKNTLTKTVTGTDGKTGTTGTVEVGKDFTYTLTANVGKKDKIGDLAISDPLDKALVYQSAKVVDAQGKDITDQGQLSLDKATNTVTWKAKQPTDFSGQTLKMDLKVQLNDKADLSKYLTNGKITVPNVGRLTVDQATTPSNATSVTVPTVAPSAHKAVQLTGTEPAENSTVGKASAADDKKVDQLDSDAATTNADSTDSASDQPTTDSAASDSSDQNATSDSTDSSSKTADRDSSSDQISSVADQSSAEKGSAKESNATQSSTVDKTKDN